MDYINTLTYEGIDVGPEGNEEWGILPDPSRVASRAFRIKGSSITSHILSPEQAEEIFAPKEES